jgi:hypothetical protein
VRMRRMQTGFFGALLLAGVSVFATQTAPPPQSSPAIVVRLGTNPGGQPLDGRLLLLIAKDDKREPRFQITATSPTTAQVFGLDVEGLKAGDERTFDDGVLGYPIESLSRLPAGEYTVQTLLHKYETFHLSTGHTVKLPMDRGEGQQWSIAPGNLYSAPQRVRLGGGGAIRLDLDKVIAPLSEPRETKYVKHVRIRSALLSKFWGRDMFLGAHVLLPEGFDSHPDARYPLVIYHGHFPADLGTWRETPPDPNAPCQYSDRFHLDCYNRIQDQAAYDFYKTWTSPDFPRVIAIEVQHANPYYDDSYAVNSANLGPYGDAIMKELLPSIESRFRGIGAGWARATYGGSTGGWEALAVQTFYPDDFNAAYAACPDPIDFRAYTVVDIYKDTNAYWNEGPFMKVPRPGHRNYLGHVSATLEQMNRLELVLGTKTRSGQQWDIWEAVFSPQGPDGYPVRLWDKRTGVINKQVAAYWKEHFDLLYYLQRHWPTVGPKLVDKLYFFTGDVDTYYLNNSTKELERWMKTTTNPHYEGFFMYGNNKPHCWTGPVTPAERIKEIAQFIQRKRPEGATTSWWTY